MHECSSCYPSRYPSRTLRVPFATARFLTQLEIADISSPWKRPGNVIGNVAKVLVRSLTVARAHLTGNALHPIQPCFTFRQSHQQANSWLVHVVSTGPLVTVSLKLQKCLRVALLFASRSLFFLCEAHALNICSQVRSNGD